jgi:hypothetical protein
MASNRRPRSVLFALVLCALSVAISVSVSVGTASAALLEGVTGPLQETVGTPIEEVTETLTPPVQEAAETVTRPVEEVGETVAPATQVATATVASPPVAPVKVPVAPSVQSPSTSSPPSPESSVQSAGTTVRETTGAATRAAQEAVAVVSGGILSDSPSADSDGPVASPDHTGVAASAQPGESDRPATVAGEPDLGPGEDTFEVPSNDGSVRAPFDRWLAYVWPAVALTGPRLANLVDHWEQHTLRLALGTGAAADAGSGAGPVVKGVHASGGGPQGSGPSHSLFSRIPSALDHFPRSVPASALAYLLVVAAMVLAVLIAIRWEIVHHRRQGQR